MYFFSVLSTFDDSILDIRAHAHTLLRNRMQVSAVRTTCHWVVPLPTEYLVRVSQTSLYTGDPPGHWGGRLSEQWNQESRPNSMGMDERKGATEAKVTYTRWCHDGETQAWDV